MDWDTTLAQDLCARLCHDLVGPLGTVSGALDLLDDDPEADDLARDAAGELRRRLNFWRAACGASAEAMPVSEVAALLDGMLAGGRARLEMAGLPPDRVLPAPLAQMLLVAALLAGEAVPRGGVVHLSADSAGGFALRPEGRAMAWPSALTAVLGGGDAAGPRGVPAMMLRGLSASAGWRAEIARAAESEVLLLSPAC